MANRAFIIALAAAAVGTPSAASGSCMLCGTATPLAAPGDPPLSIEIDSALDFSRIGLASASEGIAELDPDTGMRQLVSGLIDMGGVPLRGTVTIRGERNRHVRIDMPSTVKMTGTDGETIEIVTLSTTLKPNPKLDQAGLLEFSFGGRLRVARGADGEYRASIPISVDYR